jgi:ribosome biogenesis GTPase A
VDCPGLVLPSLVPMEMQVLAGILPISRVSAIPLCVHFAASLMPLEQILGLAHPTSASNSVEDKRTWRNGITRSTQTKPKWTAMDILVAYAEHKRWVTAKAGRPDVNRAGNASEYKSLFVAWIDLTVRSTPFAGRRKNQLVIFAQGRECTLSRSRVQQ